MDNSQYFGIISQIMHVEIKINAFVEGSYKINLSEVVAGMVCGNNKSGTCALRKNNKLLDDRKKICSPEEGCGAVIDLTKKSAQERNKQLKGQ